MGRLPAITNNPRRILSSTRRSIRDIARRVQRRRFRNQTGLFALSQHGMSGAALALLMVGLTVAVDRLLDLPFADPQITDASITVLGTVVGFFAVATLAVSVSLTLLQTAAEKYKTSSILDVFVEDDDRETLLRLIFVSFLVSLANLWLLALQLLRPFAALVLPVLLAFITLQLMVGYVYTRVRLFSSDGLTAFLRARVEREMDGELAVVGALDGASYPNIKRAQNVWNDIGRMIRLCEALIEANRAEDAHRPFKLACVLAREALLSFPPPPGDGRLKAMMSDSHLRRLQELAGTDTLLLTIWLSPCPEVARAARIVEAYGPSDATNFALSQALRAIRRVSEGASANDNVFVIDGYLVPTCGELASLAYENGAAETAYGAVTLAVDWMTKHNQGHLGIDPALYEIAASFPNELLLEPAFQTLALKIADSYVTRPVFWSSWGDEAQRAKIETLLRLVVERVGTKAKEPADKPPISPPSSARARRGGRPRRPKDPGTR